MPCSVGARKKGPGKVANQKARWLQKRAIRRQLEREQQNAKLGYSGRPNLLRSTAKNHIHQCLGVKTALKPHKLKATRAGFTAIRDSTGIKRVYSLDDMVGDGSRFHFKLKTWDGR
jgi:hypothetical protein